MFSHDWLFVTPWTVFPWNSPGKNTGVGIFSSPEDLPKPGIKQKSPAFQVDPLPFFTILHHQTSVTTNAKGSSLGGKKKKAQNWKQEDYEWESSLIKVRNHPHIWNRNKQPWCKYKCRILEMHLKLRPSTYDNCAYICIYMYIYIPNLMVKTNQSIRDTYTKGMQTQC